MHYQTAQTSQFIKRTTIISSALFLASLMPLSLSPLNPAKVNAQSVRTVTVVPPTIQLELAPGEMVEGTMKIINDSSEALNLEVLMQDFVVDNKDSIPNILPPDTLSNKYSASAWIGLDQMAFRVEPTKTQELHYYVKVPSNARPGGHYAASIFSPKAENQTDKVGALINSQVGTLFYVTVKGPIEQKADVVEFSAPAFSEYAPVNITTGIKNSSDIHIQPNGVITVKNMLGQTKEKIALSGKNIFPEAVREVVSQTGKNSFMFGRYTATLNAYYGTAHNLPLIATVAFWVIPWKIIVVVILALTALILGIIALRKKDTPPTEESPITTETL